MNNHSYVFIPADKLAALIETSCPPGMCGVPECGCYTGEDCPQCWASWFKDGE